jgi:hypothetical protein
MLCLEPIFPKYILWSIMSRFTTLEMQILSTEKGSGTQWRAVLDHDGKAIQNDISSKQSYQVHAQPVGNPQPYTSPQQYSTQTYGTAPSYGSTSAYAQPQSYNPKGVNQGYQQTIQQSYAIARTGYRNVSTSPYETAASPGYSTSMMPAFLETTNYGTPAVGAGYGTTTIPGLESTAPTSYGQVTAQSCFSNVKPRDRFRFSRD